MRPQLCEEALRLGRILAELAPDEPEVHGLVALMEIQASRLKARDRSHGRADPAARPEPRALGPAAHPPRPCRPRAGRGAGEEGRRCARPLCAAGRHRRLSCPCANGGGNRLGAHRRAVRGAWRDHAIARRGAQSRGGARHAVRSGGGAGGCRRADRRAGARRPITCCRACAATCCTSSAASTRPAPSSSAPPPSRATSASATCCCAAPPRAPARPPRKALARQPLRVHPSRKSGFTLMPAIGRA